MFSSSDSSRKRQSETVIVASRSSSTNFSSVGSLTGMSADKQNATVTCNPTEEQLMIPHMTTIRLTVRLKRFHGVAAWSWNANDDVCGICQSAFEGTAPGVKYPGEDCPVVWGKCGHAFHLQCVSKWLSQPSSKNSCPICRQEWEFGQNPVNTDNNSNE